MKKITLIFTLVLAAFGASAEDYVVGYVPQKQKRNLTQQELVAYAFDSILPGNIKPSNTTWVLFYRDYARAMKEQIMIGMTIEAGRQLTEAEARALYLSLPTRPVTGWVETTGLIRDSKGRILGIAQTFGRAPYNTIDALGVEWEVYGKAFRQSRVCGNTFVGIVYKQPEPKIQPDTVPQKAPVIPFFKKVTTTVIDQNNKVIKTYSNTSSSNNSNSSNYANYSSASDGSTTSYNYNQNNSGSMTATSNTQSTRGSSSTQTSGTQSSSGPSSSDYDF